MMQKLMTSSGRISPFSSSSCLSIIINTKKKMSSSSSSSMPYLLGPKVVVTKMPSSSSSVDKGTVFMASTRLKPAAAAIGFKHNTYCISTSSSNNIYNTYGSISTSSSSSSIVVSGSSRNRASAASWFSTFASSAGNFTSDNAAAAAKDDDDDEKKKVVQRRRRQKSCAVVSNGYGGASPDLLSIPGVGPRNFSKLVHNGFDAVADLKQLYLHKFFGKSTDNMVDYLQTSVGIIHKNHAESITTFIKDRVDDELKENGIKNPPSHNNRITLCVEGNISVGKTTFLHRIANETLELRDLVEIVPEPIDKWQNVGADKFNILNAFYAEPERYAYTFQNYVFVTRVMQERESSGGMKPLRLMERSVFTDRMVFVRAVHEAKWMSEMEISIYDSWFDPVVSSLPGLIPDGFIYLRASPDTCHKRMMMRSRSEEGKVPFKYLQDLHEKHESWLFPCESGNHGVLSVNKLPKDLDWPLNSNIRDRVVYLDGNGMHPSIQKVPALVLDCDPDIDFTRDIEAKRDYARQVAEFFEFVKKTKEVSSPNIEEDASAKRNQPPVLMPHNGKLWMPTGTQPFPDSVLKSLDFRKAISCVP